MSKNKIGRALTWDQLADEWDKTNSKKARTVKMGIVFDWAKKQKKRFKVKKKKGTIHKIISK